MLSDTWWEDTYLTESLKKAIMLKDLNFFFWSTETVWHGILRSQWGRCYSKKKKKGKMVGKPFTLLVLQCQTGRLYWTGSHSYIVDMSLVSIFIIFFVGEVSILIDDSRVTDTTSKEYWNWK